MTARKFTSDESVIAVHKNPFNENMGYEEAREALFLELEKTKSPRRFARLQEDYADIFPFIMEREVNAAIETERKKSRNAE